MSLSVENGQLMLGTWQAIDLWEYPTSPHCRRLACHLHENIAKPSLKENRLSEVTRNGSASSLLAGRNGARLNEAVRARHIPESWPEDGGINTELDLHIDELNDISDHTQ